MYKTFYRRRLPHLIPDGVVFDVNFRLEGTLPKQAILDLKERRNLKIQELQKTIKDPATLNQALRFEHDLYYGKFDRLLNERTYGPKWLGQPNIAEIVQHAFSYRQDNATFKLICYTIMPNHVHAIFFDCNAQLPKIMHSLKRHTGRQANIVLHRTGNSFWQNEGYDHMVRERVDLQNRMRYILLNPVDAKLCAHWKDWPFTYLNPKFQHCLFYSIEKTRDSPFLDGLENHNI